MAEEKKNLGVAWERGYMKSTESVYVTRLDISTVALEVALRDDVYATIDDDDATIDDDDATIDDGDATIDDDDATIDDGIG